MATLNSNLNLRFTLKTSLCTNVLVDSEFQSKFTHFSSDRNSAMASPNVILLQAWKTNRYFLGNVSRAIRFL